jgi:hypothetical protein
MKKFFVAYESDPHASLALKLLKELGAEGEPLGPFACPNESVTLLFTGEIGHPGFNGRSYFCCSLKRIKKHGIKIPEPGESAGFFVALKPLQSEHFRSCNDRLKRALFQQALLGLDPELVKKFKKPKKRLPKERRDRYDYYVC